MPRDFQYFTQSGVVFTLPNNPGPGTVTNSIHVTTDNEMIGPQIGAMFELHVESNCWWLNFEMKVAAGLTTTAKQATTYQNVINGVSTTYATSVERRPYGVRGRLEPGDRLPLVADLSRRGWATRPSG